VIFKIYVSSISLENAHDCTSGPRPSTRNERGSSNVQ
jgi:hypothetical protein